MKSGKSGHNRANAPGEGSGNTSPRRPAPSSGKPLTPAMKSFKEVFVNRAPRLRGPLITVAPRLNPKLVGAALSSYPSLARLGAGENIILVLDAGMGGKKNMVLTTRRLLALDPLPSGSVCAIALRDIRKVRLAGQGRDKLVINGAEFGDDILAGLPPATKKELGLLFLDIGKTLSNGKANGNGAPKPVRKKLSDFMDAAPARSGARGEKKPAQDEEKELPPKALADEPDASEAAAEAGAASTGRDAPGPVTQPPADIEHGPDGGGPRKSAPSEKERRHSLVRRRPAAAKQAEAARPGKPPGDERPSAAPPPDPPRPEQPIPAAEETAPPAPRKEKHARSKAPLLPGLLDGPAAGERKEAPLRRARPVWTMYCPGRTDVAVSLPRLSGNGLGGGGGLREGGGWGEVGGGGEVGEARHSSATALTAPLSLPPLPRETLPASEGEAPGEVPAAEPAGFSGVADASAAGYTLGMDDLFPWERDAIAPAEGRSLAADAMGADAMGAGQSAAAAAPVSDGPALDIIEDEEFIIADESARLMEDAAALDDPLVGWEPSWFRKWSAIAVSLGCGAVTYYFARAGLTLAGFGGAGRWFLGAAVAAVVIGVVESLIKFGGAPLPEDPSAPDRDAGPVDRVFVRSR